MVQGCSSNAGCRAQSVALLSQWCLIVVWAAQTVVQPAEQPAVQPTERTVVQLAQEPVVQPAASEQTVVQPT